MSLCLSNYKKKSTSGVFSSHMKLSDREAPKPTPQRARKERSRSGGQRLFKQKKLTVDKESPPPLFKDMTNDKDAVDIYLTQAHESFVEPAAESDKKRVREKNRRTYFWPVFSPSPWISSCRLVDSSRRPP